MGDWFATLLGLGVALFCGNAALLAWSRGWYKTEDGKKTCEEEPFAFYFYVLGLTLVAILFFLLGTVWRSTFWVIIFEILDA